MDVVGSAHAPPRLKSRGGFLYLDYRPACTGCLPLSESIEISYPYINILAGLKHLGALRCGCFSRTLTFDHPP